MKLRPLLLSLLWFASLCAQANTISVTTENDEFGIFLGDCSLREAVQAANTNAAFGGCPAGSSSGFDTIRVPAGRYLMDVGSVDEDANAEGDLDIISEMIIDGQGGAARTIVESAGSAGNRDRLFHLASSSAALYVYDLSLRGGEVAGTVAPDGGVIRRTAGTFALVRSVVTGGVARHGGGIYSSGNGSVLALQSTIFGNTATGSGGGIYSASGVESVLTNVTVSGNFADSGAGGISTTGRLRLASSTLAFNRGGNAAGGLAFTGASNFADTVIFYNTIFADNSDRFGGTNSDISCFGSTLHGGGFNLIQRSTCQLAQTNGSFTGDARLSPLFDFGAGVPTHALLAGSDALDAGAPSTSGVACPAGDARGVLRPDDFCDVGAYERIYDFSVNTSTDAVDVNLGDGLCRTAANQCSLRAAIQEASEDGGRHMIRLPAGTYNINLAGSGGTGGDLDIRPAASDSVRQIAVFGAGANTTRIVGSGVDRIFDIHGDLGSANEYPTAVALIAVTVKGGHVIAPNTSDPYGGGIHLSNADLLLVDAVVADNDIVDGHGGGIAIYDANPNGDLLARAQLERTAVINNRQENSPNATIGYQGGGVYVGAGVLHASNSTISSNVADNGGGLSIDGSYSRATLVNVTVAANSASGRAGGLYVRNAAVEARNSVIANNNLDQPTTTIGPDCYATISDPLVSLGYNVIGASTDCALAGDVVTNQVDMDAMLSPLDQTGLGLPTHYLYAGSPALGIAPAVQCIDANLIRVWHDQNYLPRLTAGSNSCDAGASEGEIEVPTDLVFGDGFESS